MRSTANNLHGVLDGYREFLQEKDLTPPRHRPHLVRRVQEFLVFAETHRGYNFEQTLDLLLAEVGTRVGVKPWQLQQAANAVRIYRSQFRGARKREDAETLGPGNLANWWHIIVSAKRKRGNALGSSLTLRVTMQAARLRSRPLKRPGRRRNPGVPARRPNAMSL